METAAGIVSLAQSLLGLVHACVASGVHHLISLNPHIQVLNPEPCILNPKP